MCVVQINRWGCRERDKAMMDCQFDVGLSGTGCSDADQY